MSASFLGVHPGKTPFAPIINIDNLLEDGKFKASIREELLKVNEKNGIEIKPLIRKYVKCIRNIQIQIREVVKTDVGKWENSLNNAVCRYKDKFGEKFNTVTIAIEDNDMKISDHKLIFKEFIEKRKLLEKKNSTFNNLHKCYASNK